MTIEKKVKLNGAAQWYHEPPQADWTIIRRLAWVTANLGRLGKDSTVSVGKGGSFKALSHDALVAELNPLLAAAGVYLHPVVGECQEDQITVTAFGRDGKPYEKEGNRARVAIGYRAWNVDSDSKDPLPGRDFVDFTPVTVTAYDTSDKATGKAVSYGKKYALRLMFNVATGDDVDQGVAYDYAGPARASSGPQRKSETGERPQPSLASEPHPLGMDVPEAGWQKVASVWDVGQNALSDKQRKMLYAKASSGGWSSDQVKAVVRHHLGVDLDQVPNREAFDVLLKIFTTYQPSDDDLDRALAEEEPQDDLDFDA